MKKMFKKSIAMLIAVLMVISAMPFTAITAFAATGTLSNSGFTIAANGGTRWKNNQMNIVNDQGSDNTSLGIIKFDISSLKGKKIASAKLTFSIDDYNNDSQGLVFYYSPVCNATLNNKQTDDTGLKNGSGTYANTEAATRYNFKTSNVLGYGEKNTSAQNLDVANAVSDVLASGSTSFYVFIMQKTAGGSKDTMLDGSSNNGDGWSDTLIKPANVNISYETSEYQPTDLKPFVAMTANDYGSFSADNDHVTAADYATVYKNIVYAPKKMSSAAHTSEDRSYEQQDKMYGNMSFWYGNTVMLYDGETSPQFAVGFVNGGKSIPWNWGWGNNRSYYCKTLTDGFSLVNTKWHGADGSMNAQWLLVSSGREVNCYNDSNNSGYYTQGKQTGYYANIMQYSGGNFSENYISKNLTFEYKVGNDWGTGTYSDTVTEATIYVLNYKKVIDNVKAARDFYNTIDKAHVNRDSLIAYATAVNNLQAFNPSDYNYSTNTANAVTSASDRMTSLINAVNQAKDNLKYDYTFIDINNNSTVVAAKNEAEALANKPNNTPATKKTPADDQANHKWTEYTWPASATDYKFVEVSNDKSESHNYGAETSVVETPATCGTKGTMKYTKTCTDCGHESVRTEDIPATGAHDCVYTKKDSSVHTVTCKNCDYSVEEPHDIVNGKCTKCDYIALDLTAYDAARAVLFDRLLHDTDKYTEESFAKYQDAVRPYTGEQSFNSQDEVNAATYAIVSADNLLQKKSVTIKFVVEKEDGTSFTKDSKTADWGHSVNLDTQSNYVSKWTITVNGVTSKMDSNATAIDHVATEDATITAYVSNDETETVKYSKVTFLGKNSAVVGIKYVVAGETVDTNTLLTVPAIPFYENGKWDKAEIKADGSDITVRATYVPKDGDENKCGIHFKGDTKYYNYDSYVYLFNADKSKKYAMYADADETQLITYFDGVDFYAPRRDNLYIKEVPDTSAMTATIGFTGSYKQNTTSSFNVKFWLPEGATLVETGVDLVAKFPDGTVKSAHDRATKFSERNEYTYSAEFSDSKKTIEFKPYLTYEKNGKTTTVYGASQTVEY